MKNILHIAIASIVALAMIASPVDTYSQNRRSNEQRSENATQRSSSSRSSSSRSSSSRSSSSRSSSSRSSSSRSSSQTRSMSQPGGSSQSRSSYSGSTSQPGGSSPSSVSRSSSQRSSSARSSSGNVSSSRNSSQSRSSVSVPSDRGRVDVNGSSRSSSVRSSSSRAAREIKSSPSNNAVREQSQRVGNASREGLSTFRENHSRNNDGYRQPNERGNDFMRIGEDRNVHRIPPRERDFARYDAPCSFWRHEPHYYGYRVDYLPPRYRRVRYWGIDYYCYDGIYYRPYNGIYVVCRPPFGITIAADIIADAVFAPIHFAYYYDSYRTFRAIDANNRVIDEQNRIIAQNNATIAAQNRAFALNSSRAGDAHSLADRLGLVQSYAYANQPYFYQDGVFYIEKPNGNYEVIVPPAGALVKDLPDDYDTITLDGNEFYKVDDTVYRLTLVDGSPYLEVLGQMYGSLASKYDYYSGVSGSGMKYRDLY
ncbi:MAG: DUF6515 family protein [Candidatus Cryptobacteroides sp.]|nr:DUF6515 family protein [Candidatus Cryptobacteroides sp.]MEE3430130.1 DUF6515 family protein [Candidatus Cryptobacteroides sp.]